MSNILSSLFPEEIIESVGWTLFHSLWQSTLIAVVLFTVLHFMKKQAARTRYFVAYAALLAALTLSGITSVKSYNHAREKKEISKLILANPSQINQIVKNTLESGSGQIIPSSPQKRIKLIQFKVFMQRNFPSIFILWFIGVVFFLVRMTGGILFLKRLRTKSTPLPDKKWVDKIEEIKVRLGIYKKVLALQSAITKTPLVLGHIKPVILLPVCFITGFSQKEIEAVIAHELAHIRRNDYLLNLLQSVIETLFFYHPAIWFISKSIRDEREHCCDALAIEVTGDKLNYIKALAASEELTQIRNNQLSVAFSTSQGGGLLNRVKRIKNQRNMKNNVTEGFFAASLIFISIILLSFTFDGQNLKHDLTSLPDTGKQENAPVIYEEPDVTIKDSIEAELELVFEEMEALPEEMEQLIEIAYTNDDEDLSALILENIHSAIEAVDVSSVVREAMIEVDSALKDLDINLIVTEALNEAKAEIEHECGGNESSIALETVQNTLEAVNIEEIIDMALSCASIAIESADIANLAVTQRH